MSQLEFIQVYSQVYALTSTTDRRNLLEKVQTLIQEWTLHILYQGRSRDDSFYYYSQTWISFMTSARLLNNALRHLSIGRVGRLDGAKKQAVFQMCIQTWVSVGLPVFPEPGDPALGNDDDSGLLEMMESMDVIE
ncbi:hypothetical protein HDV03_003048 [Kappamyces sp. JEL0829]|nr:hypothetical protein HDV03_003048 [Kappamyces sp. JEL0829]